MTETWTWIELIWSIANVIGVLVNRRLVRLAVAKRDAVIAKGWKPDGPRVTAGNRYIRNDLGRLACHLIGLAIGVYALVVEAGDPLLSSLAAWGLVAIMTILTGLALFDLLDEGRLDRMLAHEQELEGSGG